MCAQRVCDQKIGVSAFSRKRHTVSLISTHWFKFDCDRSNFAYYTALRTFAGTTNQY